MSSARPGSLRGTLLRWLLWPTLILLPINAVFTYREGIAVANAAYDRSLLLSARTIAERARVENGRLNIDLPYAALDMVENDIGGRLYYRVLGTESEFVAGFDDFPALPSDVPLSPTYPALVRFYDTQYHGTPVRAAAFFQPINENGLMGMILIQVAETYDSRNALTERILIDTLLRQGLLIAASIVLIVFAVRRGLRTLDRLREDVEARSQLDLTPLDERAVPAETRPFVAALNRYIGRLSDLVDLRKRFIANAAHQLRTPIAVLKTQVALAERETDPQAVRAIVAAMSATTDTAARLANQLLSLTRAEHGMGTGEQRIDLIALARNACLDFAPRALEIGLDLGFDAPDDASIEVAGDAVLLSEMIGNLLDNAIKYCASGDGITVRVAVADDTAVLEVDDSGPGIPAAERENVLKRFYRVPGQAVSGSGLGLAIVNEIVMQHHGSIALGEGALGGLRVRVILPLALPQ